MSNNAQLEYDYLFKILLIGNSNVGKSSLLIRFVDKVYNEKFEPTIGVDFKLKTLDIGNKKVKLQIWDTAGEERFRNITASYYKGGHGILFVYDITDKESFESIQNWLIEVEKNGNKNIYKILVGNKMDLEDKRQVSYKEGNDFANSTGMKFIETSAKDDLKVYDAFELIASEIIKSNINKEVNEKKNNISLGHGDDISQKKNSKCCNKK